MSAQNDPAYSWFVAVATDAAPTYPAASGANHSTTTANNSTTRYATKVKIHSIAVLSPVALNTLLIKNHAGSLTYFTISAATQSYSILDIVVESGIQVVGGTTGTATVMITYLPLEAEGARTTP